MERRILCYVFILYLISFISSTSNVYAQKDQASYDLGKIHFRTLCSSCHSAHEEIYGPMLGSISKKKELSWLIPFIQNSQNIIKSGDPYAKALFEKFNNQIMPSFKELSSADIKSILYYLEYESLNPGEYLNDSHISTTNNTNIIKGKQEFSEHCATCHFIHKESTFAPSLGSVTKRHTRDWLVDFIQNSQKKIQSGDPYAQHLFKQFDEHVMTQMDFLSAEEINSILDYIDFSSTINVAYVGEINKTEYKKQALVQMKNFSAAHSIPAIIYFCCILVTLFSMVFLLLASYVFMINK